MKKHLNVPFLLLILVIILGVASQVIYNRLNIDWNETHEFVFNLPLPQDIIERYSLTNDIQVEKIIITGPFSSWAANDEDFRMYWQDEKTWSINLLLPPGINQYKFVVHTKHPVYDSKDKELRRQIWVHDKFNKRSNPDGYGGKNSLYIVPDISEWRRVTNTALLGIGILLALYIVLKPLIQHFINMRIPYRMKLVLVTGLILLSSNVLYITYNLLEMRALSRESYIDATHFLLEPLVFRMDESLDMKKLDMKKVQDEISALFYGTSDRDEKNMYKHDQFKISSVMIIDNDLSSRLLSIRPQALKLEKLLMEKAGFDDLTAYYYNYYYTNILNNIRDGKYSSFIPNFEKKNYFVDPERPRNADISRFLTGYDTMILPLRTKRTLYGYAIFELHTDLLGLEISRILKFNIIMMVFILILMYFLLFDLGGILSMEEQARTDGLTGIFNRRSLDEVLLQEIMRARREKQHLGLIMMDLDHFKELNDHMGHLAGDTILKGAVKVIEHCIRRPADEMGRYGGEEFCIILPNTDSRGVEKVAENIRKKLEEHHFKVDEKKIEVRASFGCFSMVPDVETPPDVYYKNADQALYHAKNQGRNRVEVWYESIK